MIIILREVAWCFDYERLRDFFYLEVQWKLVCNNVGSNDIFHYIFCICYYIFYCLETNYRSLPQLIYQDLQRKVWKIQDGNCLKFILNNIGKTGWCKKLSLLWLFLVACLLSCRRLSHRAQIFKLLRIPRMDSKELIPPGHVAWRAGTTTLFPTRFLAPNRFLKKFLHNWLD